MSFSNGIRIILWICLVIIKGVSGRITDPPSNAVADVGGQAILNCTSDLTVQNWVLSKTREELDGNMPTVQAIVAGCVVQPGFTTNYEVDRPGGSNNICNLIVKATTMQEAGVYTCTDTIAGPSSILTVIDGDASITVDKQQETVEGDVVTMSYTVRYNTSTASPNTPTIQPVLSWKDPDGNNITSSNANTSTTVTSSISITAQRQNIRPYTCSISYEIKWPSPPTGLSFAINIPSSLSNPPPTSTINVLFVNPTALPTASPLTVTSDDASSFEPVPTTSSGPNAATIALGCILFISITANVILLIFLIKNQRTKHVKDPLRISQPEIVDPSNAVQGPSTYEELRHPNRIHLQPTTYEELTPIPPLYINQSS